MIKLFSLILFSIVTLYAQSFSKTYATVVATDGNTLTLSNPMPYNGMSALLLRDTPNGSFALAYIKVKQDSAQIIDKDPLGGNPLATLKASPKVGDRVIGGFLYDKMLVIAPSTALEQKAKQHFSAQFIDSQLFNSYLANSNKSANAQSYKEFAKIVGIGLIAIVNANVIEIYDPISQTTIAKEPL